MNKTAKKSKMFKSFSTITKNLIEINASFYTFGRHCRYKTPNLLTEIVAILFIVGRGAFCETIHEC